MIIRHEIYSDNIRKYVNINIWSARYSPIYYDIVILSLVLQYVVMDKMSKYRRQAADSLGIVFGT